MVCGVRGSIRYYCARSSYVAGGGFQCDVVLSAAVIASWIVRNIAEEVVLSLSLTV